MSEYIEVGQPLQFTDPNTPTRVGEIVENVSDIYNIASPRLGMQVFVKNEKKSFVVTSLKSKVIGGVDVPEAAVEGFEAVGAKSFTWNNDTDLSNMNDFVTAGVYDIKGERTRANDNLPILNTGGGHSFNARLTVLDSSIPGNGKDDDKCITQVLSFSNRLGQGEVYIRTGKGSSLDNLTWEKWSTLQRNVNVGEVGSLDDLKDNGIYSGVWLRGHYNTYPITFVCVVINDYFIGVAPRRVSQFVYGLSKFDGSVVYQSRIWDDSKDKWGEWEILNKNEISSMISAEIKKVIDGIDPEKIDSIKDIVAWIEAHGGDVTAIYNAIQQNTVKINAEISRAKGAEQTLSDTITENVENIANYIAEEVNTLVKVDNYIKSSALGYDRQTPLYTADKVTIKNTTLDGKKEHSFDISAATTESAGVMSAEDKKTINNANIAIYTNALNSQSGGNIFDKNAVGILVNKGFADNRVTIQDREKYNISDYIAVVPGEAYAMSATAANPQCYNVDKKHVGATTATSGVFTVPEGVYWIRVQYYQGWTESFCINKGTTIPPTKERTFGLVRTEKLYDAAVTTDKIAENAVTVNKLSSELKERVLSIPDVVRKNGTFITEGTLSSGDIWELPQNSISVGEYITFSANINGEFDALYIGHGRTNGAYMKITPTTVTTYSHVTNPVSEKEFEHGLTIENNIQVYIEKSKNTTTKLKITSNGKNYEFFFSSWYGNKGTPFVESEGCELKDCRFGWTCKAINSDIWAFGDSYFGVTGTIRWMAYMISENHTNLVVNGFGGQGSVSAYTDLTNLLTIGTPKKILWCLGMNDADSSTAVNANWLNTYNSLKVVCENNNIELILATIPTVPSRIHKFKNEIIRSSGYRYIDFDKAVGADEGTGAWFGDMLSSDGVHPSETGALTLYNRAIADMPELLNC